MVILFFATLVRVITTATRPVSERILDFLYFVLLGRNKRLPPTNNNILLMSARELASKIRNRQLRAEHVMATYIERCRSIHPIINAQIDERFKDAMDDALAVDYMLDNMLARGRLDESKIARDTPLLGVPFSCKEVLSVKGMIQANGSLASKNRRAPYDADVVAIYRRAGAIPLVVTNIPELSMWWESANLAFGRTKNPYDHRRTPGGSSGGEAAIISACGSVIGLGTDIAGSIRIPASFCGIYGHKASRGLISNKRAYPYMDKDEVDPFVSTGPICRYVEDLPMLTWLLAGDKQNKVTWHTRVDFRRVKVFYMEELPGWLLSATKDIKDAVMKAVKHFEEEYGIKAVKLDIPELKYGFPIWEYKILETGAPPFKAVLSPRNGDICIPWEFIKSLFRRSSHTLPALYYAAVDRRSKDKFYYKCLDVYENIHEKLENCLNGDSILLLPTHPDPPPHYLMTIPKYPNIAYTCIFNILGYPSTQVPAGLSKGLPIGIQIIGTQYKDSLTLAAAVELDKVFNGWINPSPSLT